MESIQAAFAAAMKAIKFFSDEDPSGLHYQAAREILREDGGEILESEEKARDLLARALVGECKKFSQRSEAELISAGEGIWLDELFSSHLEKMGERGKALAKELLRASCEWQKDYQQTGDIAARFRLWKDPAIVPYGCRYVKLLAEVLWRDTVQSQFYKVKEQLPAMTQSIQRPLCRLLSSRAEKDGDSVLFEGRVIAKVAAIDPRLIPLVMRGAQNLNSIYHHKLIRLECRKGFENWAQGNPDPRVIRYERGETEIAEALSFKCKEAPTIIKSLLHAQAHMQFYFDDGSRGNLISLGEFRSALTNREEGLEIVLGTQLMPYYTFQTDRRGRLLVPVPELPPFVSAPQYHGGQALLQMLVMEEFTAKSMELATEGAIEILPERWGELWKQSGLPETVFNQTKMRWFSDGDDGFQFLECTEPNRYTIGRNYFKELQFLKAQGKIRKERQRQGKMSVVKRRKKHALS